MRTAHSLASTISEHINRNLIWLLIATYAVAAFWPALGLCIRRASLGDIALDEKGTKVMLLSVMLGSLLFNAGIGIRASDLQDVRRNKWALIDGLMARLMVPMAFVFSVGHMMRFWHNPVEAQIILVGLALVISMPIAGSSTAWVQNANGNLALCLSLVVASTLLSPFITPIVLQLIGKMASGEYARAVHVLESHNTGLFLILWVALPALLGIMVRGMLHEARMDLVRPYLKLVNSLVLLLLNYSNASLTLPQIVARPDPDFLFLTMGMAVGLCVTAFASGHVLARLLETDQGQRISLIYGLGMNNNGTGLVLASLVLGDYPRVMLPIIFYNLIQHLVAGIVHFALCHRTAK